MTQTTVINWPQENRASSLYAYMRTKCRNHGNEDFSYRIRPSLSRQVDKPHGVYVKVKNGNVTKINYIIYLKYVLKLLK